MLSLVIPVFRNSEDIPGLLRAVQDICRTLNGEFEVIFVVDGSPDDCAAKLAASLPRAGFSAHLVTLSRNFGSFAAIRAGLEVGSGDRFAVMAADLQEPPELIVEFDRILRSGQADIVMGERIARADPALSRYSSKMFWGLYRRFVESAMPSGGVDVFGCDRRVRDQILLLQENNSSLVGLLFWVGFRRATVPYSRRQRTTGRSAWTLRKKLRYVADSVFAFSDLPIVLLYRVGLIGMAMSVFLGLVVLFGKLTGNIDVPGYATSILVIMFFGALNCFGLGVIGGYVWRTFENTKQRPNYIVASHQRYGGNGAQSGRGR